MAYKIIENSNEINIECSESEVFGALDSCVQALFEYGIKRDVIEKRVNNYLDLLQKNRNDIYKDKVEVIEDNEDFTVHKININGLSTEEISQLIQSIIQEK